MNTPNLPLYLDAREAYPMLSDGHRGLWYDRFFNQYDNQWQVYKEDEKKGIREGKRAWIETLGNGASDALWSTGDATALHKTRDRLAQLCTSRNGKFNVFVASWHFATGLGNPHPVENGFLWHPTLGVPYIPGAAVKGLVRAWMEGGWVDARDNEKLRRWFGSEDKNAEACKSDTEAGAFIFFDALPVEPVKLKADVMTPHMGDWYEKGGEEPMNPEVTPADWHNPVPVPFLVADKPKFLFAVAPRNGKSNAELGDVMAALASTLEWLGAGAKTAVGYGRLSGNEKESKAICKRIRQAAMSTEERIVDNVEELTPRQLAIKLGKERTKTKAELGDSWEIYLEQILSIHGEQIKGWEHAFNKNEKEAYKTVFKRNERD